MKDCLFCRIIRRELPAQVEYEDDDVLAFQDIHPAAPVHVLIIPKKHLERVSHMKTEEALLMGKVLDAARRLAKAKGWQDYRLVFNDGPEAGQTVYHVHLHLLSGRPMAWPPG